MPRRMVVSCSSQPVGEGWVVVLQPHALPRNVPGNAKTSAVAIVEFGTGDAMVGYENHGRCGRVGRSRWIGGGREFVDLQRRDNELVVEAGRGSLRVW